jgi:hypothetical protein
VKVRVEVLLPEVVTGIDAVNGGGDDKVVPGFVGAVGDVGAVFVVPAGAIRDVAHLNACELDCLDDVKVLRSGRISSKWCSQRRGWRAPGGVMAGWGGGGRWRESWKESSL